MPRKAAAPKSATKPSTKSKKTTSTTTSVEAAPAPTPVETTPTVVAEETTVSLTEEFDAVYTQFSSMRTQMTALASALRQLQKRCDRELRAANKKAVKKRAKNGNRAPSGFVKPTGISKELATFLGKPAGTEMARTEVTREINQYIRAHNLQDPANGRRILPDKKLRSLLKVGDSDELTYFNLQRFMSPHFTKKSAPQVSA